MRLHAKLLFATVPVIVISLLSLGWVAYAQLRQQSEAALLHEMDTYLLKTKQQTDTFIETVQANAKLFASSNLIKRYVLEKNEADRYEMLQPGLLKIFSSYQDAFPEYREIRLLTPTGYEDTRLASVGLANLTEEEGSTPLFNRMQTNRGPFYSAIETNADDGASTLSVSRPIWLQDQKLTSFAANARLQGYLVVTAELNFLAEQISKLKIGQEGYLFVIDRQGKVLFHQKPEAVGTSLYSLLFDMRKVPPGQSSSGVTVHGKLTTIQWRQLHDDLMVIAVVPESEFDRASFQLAKTMTSITLPAIFLTIVIFYLLIRSTVLHPILKLRQAAIAIGNGQEHTEFDVSREDEIGDLSRAISDMNHKLGMSMEELQHSHSKIEQLAYRDTLTDLPNRRLFMHLVQQAMPEMNATGGKLAILFLDLDDFKRVNDTLGHEAGDILLREVSSRLKHCIRESDELTLANGDTSGPRNQVARIGGDEFIILLTSLGHPDHAAIVARRIIAEVARPVVIADRAFVVGTSIGISMYPQDADSVDGLIKNADTAMYEAKRTQKNTFRYYGAPMQANIESRLQLEDDLRNAVQREEFELYFQPQFDTHSGLMAGAEVLLRWNHPTRGMVPPDLFVPAAEDTGMITEIGDWVLLKACQQWRQWHEQGIAPHRIAVNVSQRQFALSNLVELVAEALHSNGMQADSLELELTESCMMEAPAEVVQTLHQLRAMGVRIAMDDFGTGYSSLGALTSLPIDTLKIDRSFVSGIEEDSQNSKVVTAILMLARSLDLEIVAEGVEVQAELDYLAKRDCDIVQGYLLGRPLAVNAMSELLIKLKNTALKQAS